MSRLLSEAAFLACIGTHFANAHPHLERARGDDAAELRCPPRLCLSTDLFLEGVHFRRSYFSPADVGYKSLAVNLSDMAASGAVPQGFSLGLMVPADDHESAPATTYSAGLADHTEKDATDAAYPGNPLPEGTQDTAYWDAFFSGMAKLAGKHNIALSGGDLSRAPMLGVSITIWGAPVTEEAPASGRDAVPAAHGTTNNAVPAAVPFLHREEAAPGDILFLLGEIGLARIGFLALESMGRGAGTLYPAAVAAHLHPVPLVHEGRVLARLSAEMAPGSANRRVGLMDVSDGLARDLPRLLGTDRGLVANLSLPAESVHPETEAYCLANDLDTLEQITLGGEDYALLGTCPAEWRDALLERLPAARILGTVAKGTVHTLNGMPWEPGGFDHFAA